MLIIAVCCDRICVYVMQVCIDQRVQFIWFPIQLAGFTCMIIVRFDVILGKGSKHTRADVLHMMLAVAASIGLAIPLARVYSLGYVPAIAVAIAGVVYLASHFAGRMFQRKDSTASLNRYAAPHSCESGFLCCAISLASLLQTVPSDDCLARTQMHACYANPSSAQRDSCAY